MRYIFNIPMYDCKIELTIQSNITSKFQSLCKKLNGEIITYSVAGAVVSKDMNKYYILLDSDKLSHNLISHELYHLTASILEDRAIEDEETGAWLSGHLASTIYRFIDKKKLNVIYG